eukprot:2448308-Rhodomonas_salina.1
MLAEALEAYEDGAYDKVRATSPGDAVRGGVVMIRRCPAWFFASSVAWGVAQLIPDPCPPASPSLNPDPTVSSAGGKAAATLHPESHPPRMRPLAGGEGVPGAVPPSCAHRQ